jgi:hypothetical protein
MNGPTIVFFVVRIFDIDNHIQAIFNLNISKYAKTITLKIELETNETKVQSF